jgi:hypothetical protein
MLLIDGLPSMGKELSGQEQISLVRFLTIDDHPHILHESVDNLKGLFCGRLSLIKGESI